MLPWLTLLTLTAAAAKVFCTPKQRWRAYRASFVARHGLVCGTADMNQFAREPRRE